MRKTFEPYIWRVVFPLPDHVNQEFKNLLKETKFVTDATRRGLNPGLSGLSDMCYIVEGSPGL